MQPLVPPVSECAEFVNAIRRARIGFAIAKMEEEEAKASLAFFQGKNHSQGIELPAWAKDNQENESDDKGG
jgi:hypothetical protein